MVAVGTYAFVLNVSLIAMTPEPEMKKEKGKNSCEKLRQSESKLCLKVCFGVERP